MIHWRLEYFILWMNIFRRNNSLFRHNHNPLDSIFTKSLRLVLSFANIRSMPLDFYIPYIFYGFYGFDIYSPFVGYVYILKLEQIEIIDISFFVVCI